MTTVVQLLLFVVSGLFSLVLFSHGRFFATSFGDMDFSKADLLCVLGGAVLLLGGLARFMSQPQL